MDKFNSYQSQLVVTGNTFTATYIFTDTAVGQSVPHMVATGGGERVMAWEVSNKQQCAGLSGRLT